MAICFAYFVPYVPSRGSGYENHHGHQREVNLYKLIDETSAAHEPIIITGKRSNAVLVAEEDWASIQETLFLLSIPGMRESIREGMEDAGGGLLRGAGLVNWKVVYTRQAQSDARNWPVQD